MTHRKSLIATAIVGTLLLSACGAGKPDANLASAAADTQGQCITNFDATKDYFPDKVKPTQATNFTVEYHNSYKVVRVPKPNTSDPAAIYVLVQCGAPKPELSGDLANAQQITIPVKTIASSSSTQIASLDSLGVLDRVVGAANTYGFYSEKARQMVTDGKIVAYGNDNGGYDVEKIVATKADLVMQSGMPDAAWGQLRDLGVKTVAQAGWLEPTALGRSEWIKYDALFLDREKLANEKFNKILDDYNAVKAKVASSANKPTVMVGTEFKGTWTVPGANSYVAKLVADAGGAYVFASLYDGSGTKKIDAETIFTKGAAAKIWLNGNWMSRTRWQTKADALAADERVGVLSSVKNNQIWNPTKSIAPNGANDYWESGVMRPDLILKELAAAFYPDQFTDVDMHYYAKLPA